MSQRSSSVTKSELNSESTTGGHFCDRWSNNISYRHLIVSSCIGIVQLWWHPYLHDMSKLLPFLFLYNIFSLFAAYPLFYLELTLGMVTKKSIGGCWDISPVARGVGLAMLCLCICTVLTLGTVSAWCLEMLVHSFHSFLPWLHCAASAVPACAARHRPMSLGSEIPPQSFFYNYVLKLKRDNLEKGFGNVVMELSIYHFIAWLIIYLISVKRIYSYSKIVLFKDTLVYFSLLCCVAGAFQLRGADTMYNECKFSVIFEDFKIWREALEFALIQMSVSQGTVIMLGSYCSNNKLTHTAFYAFLASKICCMAAALTLGAVHGALEVDYDSRINLIQGSTAPMIIWSDLVARIPGSQFWSALIFFTLFVLAVSSAALLMQTLMSVFSGTALDKFRWAFLITGCALLCFISVITLCTQSGAYILDFLMHFPVSKTRLPIAAVVSAAITYVYGQTNFCEDIYFAIGEYPCVFFRLCWAMLPVLLSALFISGFAEWTPLDGPGWSIVAMTLVPIPVVMLIYLIFKFRVRNIVSSEE